MKKNNVRRNFRGTNNTNITLVKADHKSAVFEITSNRVGFRTVIKLRTEQIKRIINTIKDCAYSTMNVEQNTIDDVLIKHRELTKRIDEFESTYKYFDTNKGIISIVHLGDQLIMSIGGDHEFATLTCSCYEANNALSRLHYVLGEECMNEWIR